MSLLNNKLELTMTLNSRDFLKIGRGVVNANSQKKLYNSLGIRAFFIPPVYSIKIYIDIMFLLGRCIANMSLRKSKLT